MKHFTAKFIGHGCTIDVDEKFWKQNTYYCFCFEHDRLIAIYTLENVLNYLRIDMNTVLQHQS